MDRAQSYLAGLPIDGHAAVSELARRLRGDVARGALAGEADMELAARLMERFITRHGLAVTFESRAAGETWARHLDYLLKRVARCQERRPAAPVAATGQSLADPMLDPEYGE